MERFGALLEGVTTLIYPAAATSPTASGVEAAEVVETQNAAHRHRSLVVRGDSTGTVQADLARCRRPCCGDAMGTRRVPLAFPDVRKEIVK